MTIAAFVPKCLESNRQICLINTRTYMILFFPFLFHRPTWVSCLPAKLSFECLSHGWRQFPPISRGACSSAPWSQDSPAQLQQHCQQNRFKPIRSQTRLGFGYAMCDAYCKFYSRRFNCSCIDLYIMARLNKRAKTSLSTIQPKILASLICNHQYSATLLKNLSQLRGIPLMIHLCFVNNLPIFLGIFWYK